MSKESSHNGATTGNTYTDLGATTKEAYEISAKEQEPCEGDHRKFRV